MFCFFPVEAESQPQTTKSTTGATTKRKQKLQNEAIIYKLFVKMMGDQAQCKICSKVLSTPQGSTTSIRSHAARFHEIEWQNIQANNTEDGKIMSENFVKSEDDSEFKSSSTDSHLISYFKTPNNKLVKVKLESKNDVSGKLISRVFFSENHLFVNVISRNFLGTNICENDGGECDQIDALDNQAQLISLISEDQNANNRS